MRTLPADGQAAPTGAGATRPSRRLVLPLARSPATEAELALVPEQWRGLCVRGDARREWRSAQTWLLEAVHRGRDFTGTAATGVGKSSVWLAPAAAEHMSTLLEHLEGSTSDTFMPPVQLVVVPLTAQGLPHEAEGCDFLRDAALTAWRAAACCR